MRLLWHSAKMPRRVGISTHGIAAIPTTHTLFDVRMPCVYSHIMNAFGAISASRISLQGLLYRIDARDSLVSASIDVDQGRVYTTGLCSVYCRRGEDIIPVCKSKYIYGAMILSGRRFIIIAIKELFVCRFYHIKKIGNIKVVLLLCCAIYIAMKCVWMYYRLQTAPEPNKVPYEFISI